MPEESLGTVLLTRTTRSMSLTDAGQLYYGQATGTLDAVTLVEAPIRGGAGVVRGHLKVNESSSFGQTGIAPILPEFLDAYSHLLHLGDQSLTKRACKTALRSSSGMASVFLVDDNWKNSAMSLTISSR